MNALVDRRTAEVGRQSVELLCELSEAFLDPRSVPAVSELSCDTEGGLARAANEKPRRVDVDRTQSRVVKPNEVIGHHLSAPKGREDSAAGLQPFQSFA
jgi:hypothetical protein